MLNTETRIRVQKILKRIEKKECVSLQERIFVHKIARVSSLVAGWLSKSLGEEAINIDKCI